MTVGSRNALIDLTGRQPPWPQAAVELWAACLNRALSNRVCWRTPPPEGMPELREVLAVRLGAAPEEILVTSGVRAAASLLTRVRRRPTIMEQPSFSGIPRILAADGGAIDLASWREMSRPTPGIGTDLARYWITAPCRNPDGADPNPDLIAALRGHQLAGHEVVVNEVYRWSAGTPVGLPADWYVGSLAKVAGGGLRVGWLRGDPEMISEFARYHVAIPPTLWQLATARFLAEGGLTLLEYAYVTLPNLARERFVEAAAEILETSSAGGGPFVFLRMPVAEPVGVEALQERGVLVGRGRDFLGDEPAVRLCFTQVSAAEAVVAARRIAEAVRALTK